MKKTILYSLVFLFLTACGPSKKEFTNLQNENARLLSQIDSLNNVLDQYKYSPDRLLADAKRIAQSGNKSILSGIVSQIKKYHPSSKECEEVQKIWDKYLADEQASIEAARQKKLKEKQDRLKAVNKLKKSHDDIQDITWYKNPYFTHYDNANLTSLYMGKSAYTIWLRLKMSYTGDDWIFFDNAYLSYDGHTREIVFDKYKDKKSDNSGGYVWEWIDVPVDYNDISFLKQMVNGKSVKMRLSGKYSKTRNLSTNEIKAIKEMIMAYEVLKEEQ